MLIALTLLLPAKAQRTNIYQKSPGFEQWRKQHEESEQSQPLRAAPDLPELPGYPRKSIFQGGRAFLKAGPSYFFRFAALEESRAIIDWYKGTLAGSGWTINNANATTLTAVLKSTGSRIVVSVSPETHGTGRTMVSIHYTKGNQHNQS